MAQLLPLLELLLYCVPLLPYTWPPLTIALVSKGSNYGAQLFKRLIEAKARPGDYSQIDCYLYDETVNLPELSEKYDLVLSDSPYGESEEQEIIQPYLDHIGRLFSNHRDLCHDTLKTLHGQIVSIPAALNTEKEVIKFLEAVQKRCGGELEELQNAYRQATIHDHVMVMIIHTKKLKANLLQLGIIEPKLSVGIHKLDRYVVLAADITAENFFFYNVLLREIATDEIFLSSLILQPSFKLINQQLNAILA